MVYSGGTGANQGLKSNRNLFGKKDKIKLSYSTKKDTLKSFPEKATEKQLERIRRKLGEQKRREQIKFSIAVLTAIVLILLFSHIIDWRFLWDNFR